MAPDLLRTLARLTAAIVAADWTLLAELRRAAGPREPDRAWREAVLQTHLFCGFPSVVEACEVLARAGGLGTPSADEARWHADRFAAGRELFDRIYRANAQTVRGKLRAYHPLLSAWIEGHAYGRVLARDGLDPALREVLACVALATLGQERQLASHARGARHLGARREQLFEALEAVADLLEGERLAQARATLSDSLPD